MALLDRARGLLWTGDTFLEGAVWLFVPETDLDDYERSLARLAALPGLTKLLPAHSTATAEPSGLGTLRSAVRRVREGLARGKEEPGENSSFSVDGFQFWSASASSKDGSRGRTAAVRVSPPRPEDKTAVERAYSARSATVASIREARRAGT